MCILFLFIGTGVTDGQTKTTSWQYVSCLVSGWFVGNLGWATASIIIINSCQLFIFKASKGLITKWWQCHMVPWWHRMSVWNVRTCVSLLLPAALICLWQVRECEHLCVVAGSWRAWTDKNTVGRRSCVCLCERVGEKKKHSKTSVICNSPVFNGCSWIKD